MFFPFRHLAGCPLCTQTGTLSHIAARRRLSVPAASRAVSAIFTPAVSDDATRCWGYSHVHVLWLPFARETRSGTELSPLSLPRDANLLGPSTALQAMQFRLRTARTRATHLFATLDARQSLSRSGSTSPMVTGMVMAEDAAPRTSERQRPSPQTGGGVEENGQREISTHRSSHARRAVPSSPPFRRPHTPSLSTIRTASVIRLPGHPVSVAMLQRRRNLRLRRTPQPPTLLTNSCRHPATVAPTSETHMVPLISTQSATSPARATRRMRANMARSSANSPFVWLALDRLPPAAHCSLLPAAHRSPLSAAGGCPLGARRMPHAHALRNTRRLQNAKRDPAFCARPEPTTATAIRHSPPAAPYPPPLAAAARRAPLPASRFTPPLPITHPRSARAATRPSHTTRETHRRPLPAVRRARTHRSARHTRLPPCTLLATHATCRPPPALARPHRTHLRQATARALHAPPLPAVRRSFRLVPRIAEPSSVPTSPSAYMPPPPTFGNASVASRACASPLAAARVALTLPPAARDLLPAIPARVVPCRSPPTASEQLATHNPPSHVRRTLCPASSIGPTNGALQVRLAKHKTLTSEFTSSGFTSVGRAAVGDTAVWRMLYHARCLPPLHMSHRPVHAHLTGGSSACFPPGGRRFQLVARFLPHAPAACCLPPTARHSSSWLPTARRSPPASVRTAIRRLITAVVRCLLLATRRPLAVRRLLLAARCTLSDRHPPSAYHRPLPAPRFSSPSFEHLVTALTATSHSRTSHRYALQRNDIRLGAKVVSYGADFDEAKEECARLAAAHGVEGLDGPLVTFPF
ncbi:hypothetical protein GGX14DRAFT_565829 [Mycena pura]|uniref:Uncharacterized protein n=1 Tax=Mycena pura TaxID=153505 RepID=A0AAD6VFL2_9AGAR|nr:hypothetical protein GGX14DRAFT_565829 [Mycena pura]